MPQNKEILEIARDNYRAGYFEGTIVGAEEGKKELANEIFEALTIYRNNGADEETIGCSLVIYIRKFLESKGLFNQ